MTVSVSVSSELACVYLLTGKSIGNNILDGPRVFQLFNGRIEKMKGNKYVVTYWNENETYDGATCLSLN